MEPPKHPSQPLYKDSQGVIRFKQNKIVEYLKNESQLRGMGLNHLVIIDFPKEDWDQFYQLIGYSVSGYGELSMVSEEAKDEADKVAHTLLED